MDRKPKGIACLCSELVSTFLSAVEEIISSDTFNTSEMEYTSETGEPVEDTPLVSKQNRRAAGWIREGQDQSSFNTGKLRNPSSLDFERVVNEYSIQTTLDRMLENDPNCCEEIPTLRPKRKTNPFGYTGRTATRWVLTMMTGILIGLIAIFILRVTDFIQTWRSNHIDQKYAFQSSSGGSLLSIGVFEKIPFFVVYASANLSLALLSSILCLVFVPAAIGSGIPEVKVYLNGVRVKRFASFKLFAVKIIATILSLSSGLAIGPEGPLIHVGAIIGASCTKISSFLLRTLPRKLSTRLWSVAAMDLTNFSTDWERRDLVSVGAAAGFAAAFGAPIGGLLFTAEEASSYFDHSLFMKTLVGTALATFCLAVNHGNLSEYSIISLSTYQASDGHIFQDRVAQLPLYVLIAVCGGTIGGLFCRAWEALQLRRKRAQALRSRYYNLTEVAVVSLLTSTLCYFVPRLSNSFCRAVAEITTPYGQDRGSLWIDSAHRFDCPAGQVNELATIIFGSREAAISAILADPTEFCFATLVTTGLVFLPLMTITLGISIPSGIFMPTFLIGCSLGGAAGIVLDEWFPGLDISPSTFSLLGSAALLAGIQRSTVSLCVILVEGTGQVKVLIPVILTVVIARYVGDIVCHHGLYEAGIEVNAYPYLDHATKKLYDIIPVSAIMSSPVTTVSTREKGKDLVTLLRTSSHNGFPVLDDNGNFLGLVRRDQIVALLECGIFQSSGATAASHQAKRAKSWRPRPGVGESSLMHFAFHIDDDRYDHIDDTQEASLRSSIYSGFQNDDFDSGAWLVSIRQSQLFSVKMGDDTLPTIPARRPMKSVTSFGSRRMAMSQGSVAKVASNSRGNVYVKWLHPDFSELCVDLAAVMNKGAYCVTETTPLSKAHSLFTKMGLRHLVVLGTREDSDILGVVGIVTRVNLLKDYIEEKTKCKLK